MPDWGEPVKGAGSAHDFNSQPELIAEFQRSEQVDVPDFNDRAKLVARTIHRFFDNGVPVDVWGTADLDGKLRAVEPGSLVRIVFTGSEPIGDQGKTIKRFTVQVDTSGPAPTPPSTASDDDIPFMPTLGPYGS